MVKDPDSPILDHARAAGTAYMDAGIALHRALKYVEIREFEGATDDLDETVAHLDDAAAEMREALALADAALREGMIRTASEEGLDRAGGDEEKAALVFEQMRRTGDVEELFLDDQELWAYLEASAVSNDPFAGYALFASRISQLRNQVAGLRNDVEADHSVAHIQNAVWRLLTCYMRTVNLGNVISYVNRETRGGVD